MVLLATFLCFAFRNRRDSPALKRYIYLASAALTGVGCRVVRGAARRGGALALRSLIRDMRSSDRPAGIVVKWDEKKTADRLHRLVEGLLNFGRLESGALRYRFERLDSIELVRAVGGIGNGWAISEKRQ